VISVDPMGWHESVIDWKERRPLQDMLVVVTKEGELSYWTPRLDEDGKSGESGKEPWVKTGMVKTGKTGVMMARCSSRKKTAMGESSALEAGWGDRRQCMTCVESARSLSAIVCSRQHPDR
jgi:hypothetical protein